MNAPLQTALVPRRSRSKPLKVVITGASGALGQLLARHLHKSHHVIGVDHRPFKNKPKDVEMHALDLRRKSSFDVLRAKAPDIILHVGVIRNPLKHQGNSTAYHVNLETTNQLVRLAEVCNTRKFVFVSTANLYGPSAGTAGFLAEDAPLHGADRSPEIRDLVALDMMIQSFFWRKPDVETVIVRPVHMIGTHLNNAPTRYLRLPYLPTLMGYDPMIQAIDETDVVRAIAMSLQEGMRGIFNLVGHGHAPLTRIARALGTPMVPVPEFALRMMMNTAFRYKMTAYPPGELDHLKYTCLVDGARAEKELGFKAKVPLRKTLAQLAKSARPKA